MLILFIETVVNSLKMRRTDELLDETSILIRDNANLKDRIFYEKKIKNELNVSCKCSR